MNFELSGQPGETSREPIEGRLRAVGVKALAAFRSHIKLKGGEDGKDNW